MSEADIYRKALIRLYCMATDGKRRKTLDKKEIAAISGPALDRGNAAFVAAKKAAG